MLKPASRNAARLLTHDCFIAGWRSDIPPPKIVPERPSTIRGWVCRSWQKECILCVPVNIGSYSGCLSKVWTISAASRTSTGHMVVNFPASFAFCQPSGVLMSQSIKSRQSNGAVLFLEQAHEFLRKPVNLFLPGRFIRAARQTQDQQRAGHRPADFAAPGHAAAERGSEFESSLLIQTKLRLQMPRKPTASS